MLVTVDDSASYEYFACNSLLAVSAYYPAPNNHIFSNTISWLFYQLCPGYWWSMRGPVLLVSTAGWFLGLLRRTNFRIAGSLAVLAGFGWLAVAACQGRLPARQAAYVLRVGVPALWFIFLSYALLLVQRVQAPNRILCFKAIFMFLLIGIGPGAAACAPACCWGPGYGPAGSWRSSTTPTNSGFLIPALRTSPRSGCYGSRRGRWPRLVPRGIWRACTFIFTLRSLLPT